MIMAVGASDPFSCDIACASVAKDDFEIFLIDGILTNSMTAHYIKGQKMEMSCYYNQE